MSRQQLRQGGSNAADPRTAAADLHRQIGGPGIGFALIFFSPSYDLSDLIAGISAEFGDMPVFGCTTAGEITPFGYVTDAICGIGFPAEDFKVVATLFESLHSFDIGTTTEQTRQLTARRNAADRKSTR